MSLHNVMSITKGAIGLLYAHAGVDVTQPLWPRWKDTSLTLEDALHHRAGMHDDDGPHKFDYDAFRQAVKRSATSYAARILVERKSTGPRFGYSNLAWQLLAFRFEEITGTRLNSALEKLIGPFGWKWETDGAGTCLGPYGLEMSGAAARRLGDVAMWLLKEEDFTTKCPAWFWPHQGIGKRFIHNGWFAVKEPRFVMYAVGFRDQYLVVSALRTRVQLRGDAQAKFDHESTPDEAAFLRNTLAIA